MPVQSFPLFRLPDNVVKEISSQFTIIAMLAFSFCTKECKEIIKSRNPPLYAIVISQRFKLVFNELENMSISIAYNMSKREKEEKEGKKDSYPFRLTVVSEVRENWEVRSPNFAALVKHFLDVSNLSVLNFISVHIDIEYRLSNDYSDIFSTMKTFNIKPGMLVFQPACRVELMKHAIQSCEGKNIRVNDQREYNPEKLDALKKCMVQNSENFTFLHNNNTYPIPPFFTMEHCLSVNSETMNVETSMCIAEANRFLKMWIRGSNKRLKLAEITLCFVPPGQPSYREDADDRLPGGLVRGIGHNIVELFEGEDRAKIIDIRRKNDGVPAKVTIMRWDMFTLEVLF